MAETRLLVTIQGVPCGVVRQNEFGIVSFAYMEDYEGIPPFDFDAYLESCVWAKGCEPLFVCLAFCQATRTKKSKPLLDRR